jgi:hypothetical protein
VNPCGYYLNPDTGIDEHMYLIAAYQKLLIIYSHMLYGNPGVVTPIYLHNNYIHSYNNLEPSLEHVISVYILNSPDILEAVDSTTRDIITSPINNQTFTRHPSVPIQKVFQA